MWNKTRSDLIMVAMLGLLLASCRAPFDFSARVNEEPVQQRAMISLSDPQIYARETLIEDRRKEIAYLDDLLERSKTIQFESQIRRDLRSISALAAQLGISFDPAKGIEFARAKELGDVQQEIKKTQLQIELAELQNRAKQAQGTGTGTSSTQSMPDVALPPRKSPGLENAQKIADALITLTDKVLDLLNKDIKEVRDTAVKSTPQEEFRDRQAYRGELRAALGEVNLDDVHDRGGNALYRLQFRATVMPGEYKDKYAVARLTAKPLMITNAELQQLYMTWLGHVTYRLNQRRDSLMPPDVHYEALGLASGLYGVASIGFPKGGTQVVKGKVTKVEEGNFEVIGDSRKTESLQTPKAKDEKAKIEKGMNIKAFIGVSGKATLIEGERFVIDSCYHFQRALDSLNDCVPVRIAVPSSYGKIVEELFNPQQLMDLGRLSRFISHTGSRQVKPLEDLRAKLKEAIADHCKNSSVRDVVLAEDYKKYKVSLPAGNLGGIEVDVENIQPGEILQFVAGAIVLVEPSTIATIHGVRERGLFPDGENMGKVNTEILMKQYNKVLDISKHLLNELRRSAQGLKDPNGIPCEEKLRPERLVKTGQKAPDEFGKLLVQEGRWRKDEDEWPARGDIRAYAASPVELTQRMSTISSVAEATQMAMSLSAVIPTVGVGVDAGLGYLKEAAGKVEARERLPIIVGFSGRRNELPNKKTNIPEFGWVFGPRVVVDTKANQLKLEHGVVNQQVATDISVPGWWPRVQLILDTAWIGNWYDKDWDRDVQLLENESRRQQQMFDVFLPVNRADLDALTTHLAQQTTGFGLNKIQIDRVTPSTVSGCAKQVTFLVYGRDVWRSTKAYLGGIQHTDIQVLPDMEGIAVSFDLQKLPPRPSKFEPTLLTVWTRRGTDSFKMIITKPRTKCDEEVSGPDHEPNLAKEAPKISEHEPRKIAACATDVVVIIKGDNLTPDGKAYLGDKPADTITELGEGSVYELVFKNGPFVLGENEKKAPLIFATNKGFTTKEIEVIGNVGKCAKATAAKKVVEKAAPLPLGKLNICTEESTIFVAGKNLNTIKETKITLEGESSSIPATSQQLSPSTSVLEIKFKGFPKYPDPTKIPKKGTLEFNPGAIAKSVETVCLK